MPTESVQVEPEFRPAGRLVANGAIALGVGWIILTVLTATIWAIDWIPFYRTYRELTLPEIGERIATDLIRILPLPSLALATVVVGIWARMRVSPESMRPASAMLSYMVALSAVTVPFIFDGFSYDVDWIVDTAEERWTYVLAASIGLFIYVPLQIILLRHDDNRPARVLDVFTWPVRLLISFLVGWYTFHALDVFLGANLVYYYDTVYAVVLVASLAVGAASYLISTILVRRAVQHANNGAR